MFPQTKVYDGQLPGLGARGQLNNPLYDKFVDLMAALKNPNELSLPARFADSLPSKVLIEDYHITRARCYGADLFAWAIPNKPALSALVDLGPLMELGAGSGYWAKLIDACGGDVVAYDTSPPGYPGSWFNLTRPWFPVLYGDERVLVRHMDRTLFVCYPSPDLARAVQQTYTGASMVFVGELDTDCGSNSDEEFSAWLANEWQLAQKIEIPRYPGFHEAMYIFQR